MKLKIFKPAFAVMVLFLAASGACLSQDALEKPIAPLTDSIAQPAEPADALASPESDASELVLSEVVAEPVVSVKMDRKLKAKLHKITAEIKHLSVKTNAQVLTAVKNLSENITAELSDISPDINVAYKESDEDISYTIDKQDENELTKNYSKTYQVDANDAVAIDNRYGKVVVNTWARNEVKVDIQIKVGAGSNSEAQKILDNVTISDAKDGNTVAFKTNINDVKNTWTSIFHGNSNRRIEINYIIYMPAKNEIVIDNRYGPIVLPDMDGKVTINSAYGSFTAKSLSNVSAIRVKYGNADIGNLGSSALEVSYGNLNLGGAGKLAANINYSGASIGKIRESGAINLKYSGGLKIADVDRNMKSLAINASYSQVNVGLSGDENANFDVTVHYGDFNYGNHEVTITSKTPDDSDKGPHFTKSYKGRVGKGNTEKTIAINSNYGNVVFE